MGIQDKLEPEEGNNEPQTVDEGKPAEAPPADVGVDVFNLFDDVQAEPQAPAEADAAAPTQEPEPTEEGKVEENVEPAPASVVSEPQKEEQTVADVKPEPPKKEQPPPPKPAPPPPPPPKPKPEKQEKEKPEKKGKKEKEEKPPKEKAQKEKPQKEKPEKEKPEKEKPEKEKPEKHGKNEKKGKRTSTSGAGDASILSLRGKSSVRFHGLGYSRTSVESEEESSTTSEEEVIVKREDSLKQRRAPKEKKSVSLISDEKGKKGKGAKKGKAKKEKEEVEEPAHEPVDDFLANILKKKAQAAAKSASDMKMAQAAEEKRKKKGAGHKKGLSKAEKQKMAVLMEQMKKDAEQEAIRQAEAERIRLLEERKAAIEKEKREIFEQSLRVEQLDKTIIQTEEARNCYKKLVKEEREISEWNIYIACGDLPNPSIINKMSTYLHLWENASEYVTINEASKRTADVVKLLTDVDDLLDSSPDEDIDATKIENWKWLRQLFRDLQKHTLDVVTYRLLRCVQSNLHRIDIPTADFDFQDDNIKFSLWCRVQLPIPLPNPRRPPKSRLDVSFPNIQMQVLFPVTIDGEYMAIRVMYLNYDHLSDLSSTYHMPEIAHEILQDLIAASKLEWRIKLQYKYDHRDIVDKREEAKAEETAKKAEQKDDETEGETVEDEIPLVPYKKLEPTASDVALALEDILYEDTRKKTTLQLPDYILNLRKYTILGGVYYLNLVEQPPQPQDFATMDLNITTLYLPKRLEYVPFYVPYTPPAPPEPGVVRTPEEIEEELKIHEAEMDKLMLVTMTWPTHVVFVELPLVYHWEEEHHMWSKKDVYDLKHNEEKGTLSFRTGTFGVFGLATLKFTNLPFQAWELKPETDGSVTFQITAAIVLIEFNIKGGRICISTLKNCPTNALKGIVGKYLKFYKLKRILKETGIDIFPEQDSFCYIEGSCEKHWPMERHLYCNMAAISNCFNFVWSRWNLTAGRRNIIMQMRESLPEKLKPKPYSMLLVTPLKATFVECTEVSQVFSDEDIEGLKFSADLWNLLKVTTSITIRKKIQSASQEVVYILSELLIATRVLSFS